MTYKRTYKLTYDGRMTDGQARKLNTILASQSVYPVARWDADIDPKNYGMQTEIDEDTEWYIDFNGVEKCLSFSYRSDMKRTHDELKEAFPDIPISHYEITETKTSEKEMRLRGDYLVDSTVNHTIVGLPMMTFNGSDANPYMVVKLMVGYSNVELEFTTTWDTDKVARKPAIEKNCVEIPLPLMGRLQAIVEDSMREAGYEGDIDNAEIDCHFDAMSESRSECTPDIIQKVRDERNKHGGEEE